MKSLRNLGGGSRKSRRPIHTSPTSFTKWSVAGLFLRVASRTTCHRYDLAMTDLRIEYDAEVDAAYIYLREIEPDGAAHQCPVECSEARGTIILDLDAEGRLIGVEVLDASRGLPVGLLDRARSPGAP
jgi:uncharacterized protein YuzE